MTERPTIGAILLGSGRISEEDVATALTYQREHGGLFGEALVACGFLSEDEVEWGLASQFDLPYVFPEADAVAYEAASLVTPEWALAHLTLPIIRTDESLTVIVDSPLRAKPVEELQRRTDLHIELALASPSRIRDLIREVYARGTAADEESPATPLELPRALDAALEVAAPRFGVSARGRMAWAWWDDQGAIRRRPLVGDWLSELKQVLEPGPQLETREEGRADWSGWLTRAGTVTPVEVHYLADESGCEYLFRPSRAEASAGWNFERPPAGVVSEVQLLARTGKARFVVTAEPRELGHRILPNLPSMLFDPGWRSIYIHAEEGHGEAETFSRELPDDASEWPAELEALRAFHFDVVTVDLEGGHAEWTAAAVDVGSVAFILWSAGDLTQAHRAGIRWHLHLSRTASDRIRWSLGPLTP